MGTIRLYGIVSVLIVSSVSLIGIATIGIKIEELKKILIYLVSFSAGALMGDAFLHLLPESVETGFTIRTSLWILGGILFGLITEKVIRRNHCHMPITRTHIHNFAIMNLVGDFVHNIIDGLIIGASYLVNIPTGIATTLAVVFHEIPQEIGDFGVLIHGGFSKKRALLVNFLTALSAIIGLVVALLLASKVGNIEAFLVPFAAGSFIYIAGSDLIPELHKDHGPERRGNKTGQAIMQILAFIAGIAIMASLLLLE
ncbi:MAG: ZIP family metal transporter [candidate division SR1 bacterium CG_4_9_14_3_um_filter_40_9]|nr:MAG: ZIP family metal transporter [candidate division SR1 bacterium CG_4_9_14_3_um_filter_40_9]